MSKRSCPQCRREFEPTDATARPFGVFCSRDCAMSEFRTELQAPPRPLTVADVHRVLAGIPGAVMVNVPLRQPRRTH